MKYFRFFIYFSIICFSSLSIFTMEEFTYVSSGGLYVTIFLIFGFEILYKRKSYIALYAITINRIIASSIYFNDYMVSENIFNITTQLTIYKYSTILFNTNLILVPSLIIYFITMYLGKKEKKLIHVSTLFIVSLLPSLIWNFESEQLLNNILTFQIFLTSITLLITLAYFIHTIHKGSKSREAHLLLILSVLFNSLILIKTSYELVDINIIYVPNVISPITFLLFWIILSLSYKDSGEYIFNSTFKWLIILISTIMTVYFRHDILIFMQSLAITSILIIEYIYNRFIIYKDHETQIKLNNGGRA